MRHSIDPKPIGAFIEYTLKPLIDDSKELIELMEKNGLKGQDLIKASAIIYVFHSFLNFITAITVTGLICYTVLQILGCRLIPA